MGLEEPNSGPEKNGRLRRGIYILPSLFTVGTLVCGYYAILSTLRGAGILGEDADPSLRLLAFDNAARAIGWAILFDGLDGRIARMTNASSNFGREFDSLADVITFGVAPAFLAFAWGVRPVEDLFGPQLERYMRLGWVVTFAYLICGAARLARFNIDKGATSDRRYFVGMPIPGAAGVIAALVHCIKYPVNEWGYGLGWLFIVAVLAFLMVSRVRYYSFKALDLRRRRPYVTISLIGIVIYAIWAYSEYVLLAMATLYLLSAPLARLISRLRPHPPAPGAESSPGQEAHAA